MAKVFLGGTCNGLNWRNDIMPKLQLDYFNPVVEDRTEDCIKIENDEKNNKCNVHLYTITPDHKGYYTFVEILDAHMKGKQVVVCVLTSGKDGQRFTESQRRSINACAKIYQEYGIRMFKDLNTTAKYINDRYQCFEV